MARWIDLDRYSDIHCPPDRKNGDEKCSTFKLCDNCYVDYFKGEVQPVVTAKWEGIRAETISSVPIVIATCSNCGVETYVGHANYCSNCGARIEEIER